MRMRIGAGWSSPVARQAHNLKVVGSNPTPATNPSELSAAEQTPGHAGRFCVQSMGQISCNMK